MKFSTHLAFAMFLGLLVFDYTGLDSLAMYTAFFHLFPLIDIPLKKPFKGEPFHTIFGFIVCILASLHYWKLAIWYMVLGYVSHLVLDLFAKEELELGWPLISGSFSYPISGSDRAVFWISIIGMLFVSLF